MSSPMTLFAKRNHIQWLIVIWMVILLCRSTTIGTIKGSGRRHFAIPDCMANHTSGLMSFRPKQIGAPVMSPGCKFTLLTLAIPAHSSPAHLPASFGLGIITICSQHSRATAILSITSLAPTCKAVRFCPIPMEITRWLFLAAPGTPFHLMTSL